jgi:hypothetical protein
MPCSTEHHLHFVADGITGSCFIWAGADVCTLFWGTLLPFSPPACGSREKSKTLDCPPFSKVITSSSRNNTRLFSWLPLSHLRTSTSHFIKGSKCCILFNSLATSSSSSFLADTCAPLSFVVPDCCVCAVTASRPFKFIKSHRNPLAKESVLFSSSSSVQIRGENNRHAPLSMPQVSLRINEDYENKNKSDRPQTK